MRNRIHCQLLDLPAMAEPLGTGVRIWQRRNRLKRILKRRWAYLKNLFREITDKKKKHIHQSQVVEAAGLQPGDIVRVRSWEEIRTTLDRWNQFKRCSFMEEMRPYCGTTQRVFKRVNKFLDERDYLIKKCNGIVILEGVYCEGTKDFGPCDRGCFFFWREEWLEKVGSTL